MKDDKLLLALARLELKKSAAARLRMEERGLSISEAAEELLAMEAEEEAADAHRQRREDRDTPADEPDGEEPPESLGALLHRIIYHHGPLLRSAAFKRGMEVPWVAALKAPEKSMGNALTVISKQGKVEWIGDKKPRLLKSRVVPDGVSA